MYLASAGIGQITIADDDVVDLSNLQRQIAHHTSSLGLSKAASLKETLLQLNPEITVTAVAQRLQDETLSAEINKTDVVVDCSDNLGTRLEINQYCRQHKVPLVSGAAIRMEAQLSVFDHRLPESPCYQCLYDEDSKLSLSCSESGVIAPLVGIIGSMQALEVIKLGLWNWRVSLWPFVVTGCSYYAMAGNTPRKKPNNVLCAVNVLVQLVEDVLNVHVYF